MSTAHELLHVRARIIRAPTHCSDLHQISRTHALFEARISFWIMSRVFPFVSRTCVCTKNAAATHTAENPRNTVGQNKNGAKASGVARKRCEDPFLLIF